MPSDLHPTAVLAITATTSLALSLGVRASLQALHSSSDPDPYTSTSKNVADSSVSYSCKITPEHCDEHGRVYGGELLKLIDVAAGVVAAKHAGGPCLTISVDRVIFLQEIKASDVIHLSVAVNRAWGSSMEIGVRVMRETAASRAQVYCCHAYLTFVKRASTPSPPNLLERIFQSLHFTSPTPIMRPQVPTLRPTSTLESKRFLLAGRRRAHRIKGRSANDVLLSAFRTQLLNIELAFRQAQKEKEGSGDDEDTIASLQQEMIVEAYMRSDPDVKVEGEWVVASIEGFMDPVRLPLKEIERKSRERGHGGYRRLSVRSNSADSPTEYTIHHDNNFIKGKADRDLSPLDLAETIVMSLWIVRPQHCNSKQILCELLTYQGHIDSSTF
ncbi:hypothetical protein P7C70_g2790, partial [Phenoliferia sp. Uapishka_3]